MTRRVQNSVRIAGGLGLLLLAATLAAAAPHLQRWDAEAEASPSYVASRVPPRLPSTRLTVPAQSAAFSQEGWTDVVSMPWREASTGWQVLADQDTPIKDYSFAYGAMEIAGQRFSRGIGTYPFSEIMYALDGRALRFSAMVGVTDDSKWAAGSVRFLLFGDEFILFESDVVRAGDPALNIDVSVEGLNELRLVVDDAGDGSLGDYALWAEPRLLLGAGAASPDALKAIVDAREERIAREAPLMGADRADQISRAELSRQAIQRSGAEGGMAKSQVDRSTGLLVVANDRVRVTLGIEGPQVGRLTLLRGAEPLPVVSDAVPILTTADGQQLRLDRARAERPEIRSVAGTDGGVGIEASVSFRFPDSDALVTFSTQVLDQDSAVTLRVTSPDISLTSVHYLGDVAQLALGEDVRFLTDRSHLYRAQVRPDSFRRRAPFEATKPALIWSAQSQQGVLLTFYDYFASPAWIALRREPGWASSELSVDLDARLGDFGEGAHAPPALTVELVDGEPGADTFARFRRETTRRYPAAPLPERLPYQWGPWYVFGPGIRADLLLAQIDQLSRNFTDLGPWQFLVDAGWYVQYGREDAELSAVDFEKFPNGVREISDAAHRAGMEMILYLGTGFVHDSTGNGGEWLALRGLIERHPEWMIPFQDEPSSVRRYLLDYANPEVRSYLADILRDYFEIHGADGILLDGMADAEGQLIPREERDRAEGPPYPLLPTLDIYQFIAETARQYQPNPFIESSWLDPMAANPYVHVFRYGDEINLVDSPYPFSGFLQRLDYALFSRVALGQRSYVGTATGNPGEPPGRWWLQAAAALGTDATISYDLRAFDANTIADLRADLRVMAPFQGDTRLGPGLFPEYFATTRDGVTYLGILNRDPIARPVSVDLSNLGLDSSSYTAFDVSAGSARRLSGRFELTVPPRNFRLLVLQPQPGVLWTASRVVESSSGSAELSVVVEGPPGVPGLIRLASPTPAAVLLDGNTLARTSTRPAAGQYAYDAASGLLSVGYDHQGRRSITVRW
jgi:hypothetical protein